LVTGDAIEAGEKLRLRVCDSDRFSADDAMGKVEVELADLVERGKQSSTEELDRRADELQGERPGMRTSGTLHWSVKFHGMWEMAPEEVHERMMERKKGIKGEPEVVETPWWIEQIKKFAGEPASWSEDRKERRQEAISWITGEREKDEMEAPEAPSEELRSGVIQFHIHQCVGESAFRGQD
jgi:Ca2+-dependent lipid-binding protein